jgi:hypothetical protein
MNDLIVVEKLAEWQRLKGLVLDSVSSPITRRVYNMALDEFIDWFRLAPRPGFTKATVSAWRVSLEARGLGSSSIIIRMSAIRKLAVEATDNGLLAPELAAGIVRVKSVKSTGVRVGNWLSLRQAQALLSAPDIATVKGLRDRAILAVLLGCGLRRSEVAALTFEHVPAGFSNRQLRTHLAQLLGQPEANLTQGRMSYHLRRLRLHGLIQRIPKTHRYRLTDFGLRTAVFCTRAYARIFRQGIGMVLPTTSPVPNPLRRCFDQLAQQINSWVDQAKMVA